MHCSFWDPSVDSDDALAWRVINQLCARGLSLVNDDGTPTFFRPPHRPQVLNLLWLHEDASLPLTIDIVFDIRGPVLDHRKLSLLCRDGAQARPYPRLNSRYLPSGSDEELDMVLFVLAGSHSWAQGSVNARADALLQLFRTGWDTFAKVSNDSSHFNKWWSRDCSQAKSLFNAHPCMCTRLAFQAACRSAKKDYFSAKLNDMVTQALVGYSLD